MRLLLSLTLLLAITGGIGLSAAQTHGIPSPEHQDQGSDVDQRAENAPAPTMPVVRSVATAVSDHGAENEGGESGSRGNRWMRFCEWVRTWWWPGDWTSAQFSALSTFAAAIAALFALFAVKRQANIAAQHFHLIAELERPMVVVAIEQDDIDRIARCILNAPMDFGQWSPRTTVIASITNRGRSPAWMVDHLIKFTIMDRDADLPRYPPYVFPPDFGGRGACLDTPLPCEVATRTPEIYPLTRDEALAVLAGQKQLALYGVIGYRDVADAYYETRFFWSWHANPDGQPVEFSVAGKPAWHRYGKAYPEKEYAHQNVRRPAPA